MTTPAYVPLPINPDEGFPHAFRLAFRGSTYQLRLYINVPEEALMGLTPEAMLDISGPLTRPRGADELPPAVEPPTPILVLRVAREDPAGSVVLLQRRVVPNLEIPAGELLFSFDRVEVEPRNLNGVGSFGSVVSGKVASRWGS